MKRRNFSLCGGLRCLAGTSAVLLLTCVPAFAGAGFFQVKEDNCAWWFVTPEGKPFLSLGVNCVTQGASDIKYREDKPEYASFRFYPDEKAWAADALRRLQSWNFNTIAAWSDKEVTQGSLPDMPVLHLGSWCGMPWADLFDEQTEKKLDQLARDMVAPRKDDTKLIGWFSDNELGWYPETSFANTLTMPPENKTRQRLVALLRERYGGKFEALEQDFTPVKADSFDALEKGGALHLRPGSDGRSAINAFGEMVAKRYYQLMHDTIRRYDPNHLILGDRHNGYYPHAVARAAAPYVDVISTNASFADTKDGEMYTFYLDTLHRLTGKPVLISEYYCAAMENQSGNRNSSTSNFLVVATQAERATVVERTLRRVASLPYLVGAHWFQYHDEPPGGRGDGEDFNFGLVDINNRPYQLLTETMTRIQGQMPELHRQAKHGEAPGAEGIRVPAAPSDPFAALTAWNKTDGYLAHSSDTAFGDLFVCRDADHLYFGFHADDYMHDVVYADKAIPAEDYMELDLRLHEDQEPVRIRFAAGGKPTVSVPSVQIRNYDGGIRQTVIACVPLSGPNGANRDPSQPVRFKGEATSYARLMRMSWDCGLALHDR